MRFEDQEDSEEGQAKDNAETQSALRFAENA